eukprot:TRINITY_DN7063_c0_g1_i1.p1 TRINITY_DN7063_c0_g1~~TRINITY_DN7063_c0_g1_i1.p1  ORF type:complete len:771 (+),score=174.18 TRINITY_DN7063_c0_g1_i1:327-2639(+)
MESHSGLCFSINSASEGAKRLQDAVKEKLPQFMGYSDDVLAEYVCFLVCHGKQKEQAEKDLDAFLGDQSNAFVSWLWEHVASNIKLYTSSSRLSELPDEPPKVDTGDRAKKTPNSQPRESADADQIKSTTHIESDEKSKKSHEIRRRREWSSADHKLLTEDKETPRKLDRHNKIETSSVIENSEGKNRSSTKRQRSPESRSHKDRLKYDESHRSKRRMDSLSVVHAPRRLLQSAVREAVAPLAPSTSRRGETSSKRLRSVVSTSFDNTESSSDLIEPHDKSRAVGNLFPAMAVAMKAAAEAADDATKGRTVGSVFDRLGKRVDDSFSVMNDVFEEHIPEIDGNGDETVMDGKHDYRVSDASSRINRGQKRAYASLLDSKISSTYETHKKGYNEVEDLRLSRGFASGAARQMDFSGLQAETVSKFWNQKDRQFFRDQESEKPHEESVTVQYRLARNNVKSTGEGMKQNTTSAEMPEKASNSSKIVNISVNVNTWKAPHYHASKNACDTETGAYQNLAKKPLPNHIASNNAPQRDGSTVPGGHTSDQVSSANGTDGTTSMNHCRAITRDKSSAGANIQGHLTEDSDSRTIYVSNVHFAATKESLAKHFSRCGEVVNVIMLSDATTGQPKGSAYVEFGSKAMVEAALALNETSFMSRMLKVVRKTTANVEPSAVARPPISRASILNARRVIRSPFLRGPSAYRRGHLSRSFGTRSLQWRRDSSVTGNSEGNANNTDATAATGSTSNSISVPPRSLTYIRNVANQSSENVMKNS